jgi:hypothetical protein
MPEVRPAAGADHLRPAHQQAVVGAQLDRIVVGGLEETGPAGARFELGVGAEQLVAAGDAAVRPVVLGIDVPAGEGALGPALAGDLVLLGSELLAPLRFGFLDLLQGSLSDGSYPAG